MARDDAMHQLLLAWAQWVTVGDGSGYPTMSVLHADWSPPSPGTTPTMKVTAPSSARRTHRVVHSWSARLRDTVMVYYCCPTLTVAEMGQRLGCGPSTVHERIAQAHVLLRRVFHGPAREFRHMEKAV
jgi:DNA-directed RNA polymerase specialized sigma24 family protein